MSNLTYIIRHKTTKEQWCTKNNKKAWSTQGAAKNAWSLAHYGEPHNRFDVQNEYEIVILDSDIDIKLSKAKELLERCSLYLGDDEPIKQEITNFLGEK